MTIDLAMYYIYVVVPPYCSTCKLLCTPRFAVLGLAELDPAAHFALTPLLPRLQDIPRLQNRAICNIQLTGLRSLQDFAGAWFATLASSTCKTWIQPRLQDLSSFLCKTVVAPFATFHCLFLARFRCCMLCILRLQDLGPTSSPLCHLLVVVPQIYTSAACTWVLDVCVTHLLALAHHPHPLLGMCIGPRYMHHEFKGCHVSVLSLVSNGVSPTRHLIPDPQLTPLGAQQLRDARSAWETEQHFGVPAPGKLYTSPLMQAIQTNQIVLNDTIVSGLETAIIEVNPFIPCTYVLTRP